MLLWLGRVVTLNSLGVSRVDIDVVRDEKCAHIEAVEFAEDDTGAMDMLYIDRG